jgi:hypothetical protein
MPWECTECREPIDDALAVCWRCGTGHDGSVDPDFQHADDYEPPIPEREKPQFRLGALLKVVTALCLVFGMFSVVAAGRLTPWSLFVGLAGFFALVLLIGLFVGWALSRWARHLRRQIRADIHAQRHDERRGRQCGPTGPH